MRVRFGDFVLDRAIRQLLKKDALRPREPKAYELLDLLISRRPAAVSKQEIRDGLWPDTFVSESHLSSLAARVRRTLDAGAEGSTSCAPFTGSATRSVPTRPRRRTGSGRNAPSRMGGGGSLAHGGRERHRPG